MFYFVISSGHTCLMPSSIFQDIAVVTTDVQRCNYYKTESLNVKERWQCDFPAAKLEEMDNLNVKIPNNKEDCEVSRYQIMKNVFFFPPQK